MDEDEIHRTAKRRKHRDSVKGRAPNIYQEHESGAERLFKDEFAEISVYGDKLFGDNSR